MLLSIIYDSVLNKLNSFYVIHQNIRSIRSNFDSLVAEISTMNVFPDVIILSEVWINEDELKLYSLSNYKSYIKPNNFQRAGGVVIYVKSNLEIISCEPINFQTADVIRLDFKFCQQRFCLFAVYRLHSHNKEIFLNEIEYYFENNKRNNSGKSFFLIGDININLLENSTVVDSYTTFLSSNGFECLLKEPTRITAESATCIDHVFARIPNKDKTQAEVEVIDANVSDHQMVILRVCVRVCVQGLADKPAGLSPPPNFRTDYNKLLGILDNTDWSDIYAYNTPSSAFDAFHKKLQVAITNSQFEVTGSKNYICKLKPWMNNYICLKIKTKNKLFEKVKLHPNNSKLLKFFKSYRNKLQVEIRNLRISYYENIFKKYSGDSKRTWRLLNEVTGQKVKNVAVTNLEVNGIILSDKKVICNEFNEFFLSIVNKLEIRKVKPNSFYTCSFKDFFKTKYSTKSMFIEPVLTQDLSNVIRSLKNGTSPGMDGVNSSLVKVIYPKISDILLYLINFSFQKGIFPDLLKTAIVIPLHKSGSLNDCNNFRPISLLSTFAKIFEKLMKKKLVSFLEKTKFFSLNQFGFREGLSTETALKHFMDDVYIGLNTGKRVSGIFLDIKKAFDTVDHDILLSKLYNCGIRGNVHSWFVSYLTNRKQHVKIGSTFSDIGYIRNGVPQGSVLGSILFLIYINDLCNANFNGKVTSFADDTALSYVKNTWDEINQGMTSDLKAIQWWFTNNNMLLSPEKTKYINFNLRNKYNFDSSIIYTCVDCLCKNTVCLSKCAIVSQTDSIKYLGMILDAELNWKSHINKLKKVINNTLRYFYFLRNICNEDVLKMLYFSLVNSRLEYGIFCWGGTYETNMKPIIIMQKKFIRIIKHKNKTEASFPLFVNLRILPINYMFVFKVLKLFYILSGNLPQLDNVYKTKLRTKEQFLVPKPNFTFFTKVYCFLGPKLLNLTPKHIIGSKNVKSFANKLKTWLLNIDDLHLVLKIQV